MRPTGAPKKQSDGAKPLLLPAASRRTGSRRRGITRSTATILRKTHRFQPLEAPDEDDDPRVHAKRSHVLSRYFVNGGRRSVYALMIGFIICSSVLKTRQYDGYLQVGKLNNSAKKKEVRTVPFFNTTGSVHNENRELEWSRLHNGAFLHLSQTSTTSVQQKVISEKITAYYDHLGFSQFLSPSSIVNRSELQEKTRDVIEPYDFYVLTTRDPFERALSIFEVEHVQDRKKRRELLHWTPARRKQIKFIYSRCFPTLAMFSKYLKSDISGKPVASVQSDPVNVSSLLDFANWGMWKNLLEEMRPMPFERQVDHVCRNIAQGYMVDGGL
jgi:hypothetical protein